jgi:hypothetical protein
MKRLACLVLVLFATPSFAADIIPEIGEVRADHRAEWESALRAERATQLDRLHAYAVAQQFPKNLTIPGFGHQLLDADGIPCAVANLMIQSGQYGLVQSTSLVHNDILVAEQSSGPFADWIATSGFTKEEIAEIQAPAMIEPVAPRVDRRIVAERERVEKHLLAVEVLLRGDTDASIAIALNRLGARVDESPAS